MSFENQNPLDTIRKLNQENAEKREQYASTLEEKEALLGKVEDFKNRIGEITGTQEEMIAQYRVAIKEAKQDPDTLKYVKENFDEIFGAGKQQWREVGSEKMETISAQGQAESSIQDTESRIEKLYPQTTEAQQENLRQKEEAVQKILREEFNTIQFGDKSIPVEWIENELTLLQEKSPEDWKVETEEYREKVLDKQKEAFDLRVENKLKEIPEHLLDKVLKNIPSSDLLVGRHGFDFNSFFGGKVGNITQESAKFAMENAFEQASIIVESYLDTIKNDPQLLYNSNFSTAHNQVMDFYGRNVFRPNERSYRMHNALASLDTKADRHELESLLNQHNKEKEARRQELLNQMNQETENN